MPSSAVCLLPYNSAMVGDLYALCSGTHCRARPRAAHGARLRHQPTLQQHLFILDPTRVNVCFSTQYSFIRCFNNSWSSKQRLDPVWHSWGMVTWTTLIGSVHSSEYTDIPKVFFSPQHVGHCCTHAIIGHCWATICSTMTSIPTAAWDHVSHCCATMILVIRVAHVLGNKRQTDRHGRARKVFFAHYRAWRKHLKSIS
jgi:hypothetical protein